VKLGLLHVLEARAESQSHGIPVARGLLGIARYLEDAPGAPCCQDDGLGGKEKVAAGLEVDAKSTGDPALIVLIGDKRRDAHLGTVGDAKAARLLYERHDHFMAGGIPHVARAGVGLAAKRPLGDGALRRPVKDGAIALKVAYPLGDVPGKDFSHGLIVEKDALLHGIAKVLLPRV
jgi:hypothetical protein